jgi:hypothetical protein
MSTERSGSMSIGRLPFGIDYSPNEAFRVALLN